MLSIKPKGFLMNKPVVLVTWLDAKDGQTGWHSIEDIQKERLAVCHSTGWLMFKDETKNFGHLTRTPTQSDYPESFHVYTVWVGSRATNIQVCHFSKSDLYQLSQLNR